MSLREIPENADPVELTAQIRSGTAYRTAVLATDETGESTPVYLRPGDEVCSGCEEIISPEAYPGAPWHAVLAKQKARYGHTVCQACHEVIASD